MQEESFMIFMNLWLKGKNLREILLEFSDFVLKITVLYINTEFRTIAIHKLHFTTFQVSFLFDISNYK